jgi:hypothetical protein
LFATVFTFAFHGFLRVGEIVYTKPGQAHQIVGLKDVTVVIVGDLQSIKVRINHSKNDQRGKGVYIYINETRTKVNAVANNRASYEEKQIDDNLSIILIKRSSVIGIL